MQNKDLPKYPDDPHVDPYYVGSDKEMEDDVDDTNTMDTKINTDVNDDDDNDDDDDDDDHDGDDHDDAVASRIQ